MAAYADHIRAVLWWAVIPAAISVCLIVLAVREPVSAGARRRRAWPIRRAELRAMPNGYWAVVTVGVLFTFARFSEGFLILKGQQAGLRLTLVPLVLVAMNAGVRRGLDSGGRLVRPVGAQRVAGSGHAGAGDWPIWCWRWRPGCRVCSSAPPYGGCIWRCRRGCSPRWWPTSAPPALRGTAFGVFNLATGLVLLLASLLAGALWQGVGPWRHLRGRRRPRPGGGADPARGAAGDRWRNPGLAKRGNAL